MTLEAPRQGWKRDIAGSHGACVEPGAALGDRLCPTRVVCRGTRGSPALLAPQAHHSPSHAGSFVRSVAGWKRLAGSGWASET